MLLELDHISKIYGDLRAVDDLNGSPSSAPPAQARPR